MSHIFAVELLDLQLMGIFKHLNYKETCLYTNILYF